MKSVYQIFILFLITSSFLLLSNGCKDVEEVAGCQFGSSLDNYNLVWSDEFDGTEIDQTKWSFQIGDGCDVLVDNNCGQFQDSVFLCGWGNNELQYYTDRNENARVEDGNLVIEAVREIPFYLNNYRYTSARLRTINKGDWTYGRVDVRAKMPIGRGLWPAVWMLPTENTYGTWPCSGEIDIMEYLGHQPQEILGTIHYGHRSWNYNSQYYSLEDGGTFADDFHVFTLLWTENCIQFQVDGQNVGIPNTRSSVYPETFPFDQPFHMILNVAVGGNLPGNPDFTTTFPQRMEVDYVRVYEKK